MQVWGIVLMLLGVAFFQARVLSLSRSRYLEPDGCEERVKTGASRGVKAAGTVELLERSHLPDLVAALCSMLGLILVLSD